MATTYAFSVAIPTRAACCALSSRTRLQWAQAGGHTRRWASSYRPTAVRAEAGGGAAGDSRLSGDVVRKEMLKCYEVVERNGRGVVYLGSSRVPEGHPHFAEARSLAAAAGALLGATTWSGIGGGMMEAVTQGAMEAGLPAAGFKISREGGEWAGMEASWKHPYLPASTYLTCSFFSARKHGLVEAAVRRREGDLTAFVGLPGGIGTLDEIFEVLTLIQLGRMGTSHPVPFLLMNYGGCYDPLVKFCEKSMAEYGSVGEGEVGALWKVCDTNDDAIAFLKGFYGL